MITINRIISGGQTGADEAGLVAAKALGLKTGGWMPKGYRTDTGSRPDFLDLYGMLQHSSYSYPPRTELNVLQSDATLIFGKERSPGCFLTLSLCLRHTKKVFICPWKSGSPIPPIEPFFDWLDINSFSILNVAGNRESKNPGIFEACKRFLITTINPNLIEN
jgi:Circularly permutated YpsA SLOG family